MEGEQTGPLARLVAVALALGNEDERPAAEIQILRGTERLLERHSLTDLSVEQILVESGISRRTFYVYFSSKFGVVTALAARAMGEMYLVMGPYVDRDRDEPPVLALRRSLRAGWENWTKHRAVLKAVSEHWHAVPELQEVWVSVISAFAEAIAGELESERAAGLAPDTGDPQQIASALVWSTAQCMYVAGLGVDERMPGEDDIFEPLLALWMGALYGPGPHLPDGVR